MFIETLKDTLTNGDKSEEIVLTFLKSLDVQAFPCGRRRSTVLSDSLTRIPFDPEARLNTESNNLKSSGPNGFTQTYLESWDEANRKLMFSLAGYIFSIDLEDGCVTAEEFGIKLAESFELEAKNIYANILIEDTPLFQGEPRAYSTGVLSSLANTDDNSALDLVIAEKVGQTNTKDDYYFSGLALSIEPLTTLARAVYTEVGEEIPSFKTRDDYSFSVEIGNESKIIKKRVISLHLLEKVDGNWKIHESAKLPKIEHGDTENSVVVGDLTADKITTPIADIADSNLTKAVIDYANIEKADIVEAGVDNLTAETVTTKELVADKISQNGKVVPTIALVENNGYYQLQITLDPSKKD